MTGPGGTADDSPLARYWRALATGDTAAAVAVVLTEHDHGAAVPDLLEDVVCAAQAEVGRRWAADEWDIAQEHRATSISEEAVAALASRVPAPRPSRGTAVVTCADGEWHSLPSRVLATTLRHAGWATRDLGPSVPTAQLGRLLHDVGPDVVLLSCALPLRLTRAREVIEASRDAGVPVLVGGRGFGPDGRWGLALGGEGWAPDARGAAALLAGGGLPAFTDPAPALVVPDDAHGVVRRVRDDVLAAVLAGPAPSADPAPPPLGAQDVGYVLDFLTAALYVDDPALFTEFVGWLTPLLVARGVPAASVTTALDAVGAALVRLGPRPLPRATAILAAGRAAVGA